MHELLLDACNIQRGLNFVQSNKPDPRTFCGLVRHPDEPGPILFYLNKIKGGGGRDDMRVGSGLLARCSGDYTASGPPSHVQPSSLAGTCELLLKPSWLSREIAQVSRFTHMYCGIVFRERIYCVCATEYPAASLFIPCS